MNITKKHVKLGAAVFAGGLGATAGPAGALIAVAASQVLVDGGYHAASVIRNDAQSQPQHEERSTYPRAVSG